MISSCQSLLDFSVTFYSVLVFTGDGISAEYKLGKGVKKTKIKYQTLLPWTTHLQVYTIQDLFKKIFSVLESSISYLFYTFSKRSCWQPGGVLRARTNLLVKQTENGRKVFSSLASQMSGQNKCLYLTQWPKTRSKI